MFWNTYFCNVHREDDRVTKWIRQNYTPADFGEYYEAAIVAARIFNRIETLSRFKFKFFPVQYHKLHDEFEKMRLDGKTIWGNAYVITTHGRKIPKIDYCLELLTKVQDLTPVRGRRSCWEYQEYFQRIDGLGSFLSGQIVADLKNTEGHVLYDANDKKTFSAPGPGSLRGLSWFQEEKITPSTYRTAILNVKHYLETQGITDIDMQDLQNCMCEFDKYCRVLTGSGRSKRIYHGKS